MAWITNVALHSLDGLLFVVDVLEAVPDESVLPLGRGILLFHETFQDSELLQYVDNVDFLFQTLEASNEDPVAPLWSKAETMARFGEDHIDVCDNDPTAVPLHIVSCLNAAHSLLSPLIFHFVWVTLSIRLRH